jgi:glycogen debranching enzyme
MVQPTLFVSNDEDLNAYWRVARQNMLQLDAHYPGMPRYALAGIPEYPQFFGCDTTYSIPGLLAAGLADVAKSALDGLAVRAQAACGRVPHEITTNGRVYHPGNAQETPQFAVACWQYVAWTADMHAARRWYGVCAEGMAHVASVLHADQWPAGDGMVERHGMGPFKLDSVCYILQALDALTRWADVLGMTDAADAWRAARQRLGTRFDAAWWMPEKGLYADSLHRDGKKQLDYHWTAIVPVQTAAAPAERHATVYARVKSLLTNTWGLMHTGATEDAVWTLPTGLLAGAAFAQNDTAYGVQLLKNIGVTARHGSLGLMKELIPEGLCFVQLWSAALYCQGIVEGVLGFCPDLPAQTITLTPRTHPDLGVISLQGLVCGDHRFDISVNAEVIHVSHLEGTGLLTWHVAGGATKTTRAGQKVEFSIQRMEA